MNGSLEKSFHTQPFFYVALMFSLGLGGYLFFPVQNIWVMVAVIGLYLFLLAGLRYEKMTFPILAILFLLLGYERARISFNTPFVPSIRDTPAWKNVVLAGAVVEREEISDGRVRIIFRVDSLFQSGKGTRATFRVLVSDKARLLPGPGARAKIYKTPQRMPTASNPGMFDARYYYDMHDIPYRLSLNRRDSVEVLSPAGEGYWQQFIRGIRENISSQLKRFLTPRASAIMHALLLGRKQNIDRQVIDNFQQTGIIHVLAISGLHVGFIVLFLYTLLSLIQTPEALKLIITMAVLILFAAVVRFKAPVMRASVMIILYMWAKRLQRPVKPLQLLGLAAFIILMINPRELFLPGFQFSFAAVWGLLFGAPLIDSLIPRLSGKKKGARFVNTFVRQPFVASSCAVLATTPLTWYYYGVIQVGAILFNIVIIPFIGLIVFLGILFLLASVIPFFPAAGLASILNLFIQWLLLAVDYVAQWPVFQIVTGHASMWRVALMLAAVYAFFCWRSRRWRFAGMTALFLVVLPFGLLSSTPAPLRITYLDVGQGDACLIEFPNGKKMLLDAGDAGFGFSAGSWYIEPFLKYRGIRHLDYALISHPHADHMGGFDYLFDKIRVDTLILNELVVGSALYKNLLQKARRYNIILKHWQRGLRRRMGGTALYVLHPRDADEHVKEPHGREINDSSIVFKLQYGQTAFLFTGDAELPAEKAMLGFGDFLNSDVLKVGHHGSSTSTGERFLSLVNPRLAVVSVGAKNKFRHPSPENLRRLARKGTRILRTDRLGAIIITSDGREIRLERWR